MNISHKKMHTARRYCIKFLFGVIFDPSLAVGRLRGCLLTKVWPPCPMIRRPFHRLSRIVGNSPLPLSYYLKTFQILAFSFLILRVPQIDVSILYQICVLVKNFYSEVGVSTDFRLKKRF